MMDVARRQQHARPSQLALFGISAGGIEVYEVLAGRHDVSAAVADSEESEVDVSTITAPILALGGTADTTIPIGAQQATGQRLAAAGKAADLLA